jgi:hypothetical protein
MAKPLPSSAPRLEDLVWRDRWLSIREKALRQLIEAKVMSYSGGWTTIKSK